VAACDREPLAPRVVLFARQEVIDTAVQTASHPLNSAATLLTEPIPILRSVFVGVAHKRLALRLASSPGPVPECRPRLDPQALEQELRAVAGEELLPAFIQLYPDGAGALAALEGVIAQATCRIDVLMYLWENDPLGAHVAELLAARAGPHLRVRVLVDGGGNLLQGEPKKASAAEINRAVCWLARQPNVELIRTRNPYFRFDHRKLVVADGRLAWSGGRNFTQDSFFKDHDVSFTLAGPLAGQMEERFEAFWREQGGEGGHGLPPAPEPPANAHGRLVATGPGDRQLARTLYRALEQARHHIYIENPYFSDNRLVYELARARRRGVDVRAVLTVESDSQAVDRANRVIANRLLQAGIRVYLYPGLTHVKATSVDGEWAYLGTGNFDPLSLRHNWELGVAVGEGAVIAELEERVFEADFRPEWEVCEPLELCPLDFVFEMLASLFF
jgi:cardiolipin synthase